MGSWDEREDDFEHKPVRQTAKGIGYLGILTVVAVLVFGAIGVSLWAFGVFTSDVKGRGDAEVMKNDARNRIRAQEGFEKLHQDILAADRNLNVTAESLKLEPTNVRWKTELSGQKQYCIGLVGQYNAKARSFTQEQFRDAELPREITESDPLTDCKENVK